MPSLSIEGHLGFLLHLGNLLLSNFLHLLILLPQSLNECVLLRHFLVGPLGERDDAGLLD